MELKQNLIHRNYKKCEAKNQITIGDDYSVPDGKPDIAEILQKKAKLQVEEVHTEKGKVKLRGNLQVCTLYLAERSSQIANSLIMEFPFDEILYMENASTGDNLKIDWNIEDLKVTIIHPGKVSVRAVVTLFGEIMGMESHLVTENMESSPDIHVQTGSFLAAEPLIERRDSYRIRDEINLPVNKPNVQNILWKDLQLRGLDLRVQEGRLAIKGEVLLFLIYQGEGETAQLQWLEQAVPFHGTLDVSGLTPEMFGFFDTEISRQEIEVKPDYDGEMRMFQLEMLLEIHMHIYEERSCELLKDAYSTKEKLNLQSEKIAYEKLRMCSQAKCRISGQEKLDDEKKVLQILGHQAQLQNKRCRLSDQGILCEGNLELQILYVTSSDSRPFGMVSLMIPYSQMIEAAGMQKEDVWRVSEKIDQIFITMSDSNQIEARGVISFDACVMEQCYLDNVIDIGSEPYDFEEYKNRPGMCIHFVQPGETLWQIAKKNRTTMEEIKKINEISLDEIAAGQKLLLLKTIDSCI